MIKFYRKIRQKLLSENKFSKYLIYAIGEIVLVVIGILIALQLNTSKEESVNSQIEIAYLNGILNNINQDIYDLNDLVEKDTVQVEAYTLLLKAFTDKSINKNSREFIRAIGTSYVNHGFTGNSIVFEDMKSSGKINFIKSDVLRFSILEYYNDGQNLVESQSNINNLIIASLKNEAFPDRIDMNSLVENFIVPYKWRSELDGLDLSFFDYDINSPEVKHFANRISILKGYSLASLSKNSLLLLKAERLIGKITEYLSNETVDGKSYLSKEIFNAIKENDIDKLKRIVPINALKNCYETSFDMSSLIVVSIYENSLESLTYFVESGADIEHICVNKTPLMYAAKLGKLEMLKYLIEQGANINAVSIKGKTALSYAIQYKHPEIEAYLRAQIDSQ
jgi:hypothetical protein